MKSYLSRISIIPVKCGKRFGKFRIANVVYSELEKNGIRLRNGDILIISSKFVSMAQGSYVQLDKVRPGKEAKELSKFYSLNPHLAQLILDESEDILGGIPGFVLATSRGILAPNAGIDRSNVPHGYAIVYPKDPDKSASELRHQLLRLSNQRSMREAKSPIRRLGIILSDSRVTPTRLGTIGIALAVAGVNPIDDLRGTKDLFGNELKVTVRALADQLCSAAEIVMGEADDSIPVAVVRGASPMTVTSEERSVSMKIESDRCLIVQGLRNPYVSKKKKPVK